MPASAAPPSYPAGRGAAASPDEAPVSQKFTLEPDDHDQLKNLCGPLDQHLRQIEGRLGVEISNRGKDFHLSGPPAAVHHAHGVIERLYSTAGDEALTADAVHLFLQAADLEQYEASNATANGAGHRDTTIRVRRGFVKPRGPNQAEYVDAIRRTDINFGIGPAGTGKTYLAVACAVEALESERARRIVLVRPAVEAGERLGFLPGDLAQKVDPYLRPLYDGLWEMMGVERVAKLIERNIIEVAPLAYMRGRTLNESFIILDEAQNTSVEQMKMFLTRIGFGSTAVITGDVTQVDLPHGKLSGLKHVISVLDNVGGISFNWFTSKDVVRHPLVGRILDAYEAHETADGRQRDERRDAHRDDARSA